MSRRERIFGSKWRDHVVHGDPIGVSMAPLKKSPDAILAKSTTIYAIGLQLPGEDG